MRESIDPHKEVTVEVESGSVGKLSGVSVVRQPMSLPRKPWYGKKTHNRSHNWY